ncbi:hypothetical protein ACJRO7_029715 [Eucalyptus globulus]|uniref:Legume lectin domain-containing protein n=1 Tax=Eucalyptus globulus TaxID=34317 RepID=A0ABD3JLX7_EUCGL
MPSLSPYGILSRGGKRTSRSVFCSLLTTTTRFPLAIDNDGSGLYDDGIAFFLAPAGMPILPNSGGGFLGLFNASMASEGPRNRIVMVEFNTYVNPEFDPPVHHIGINKNGLSSVVYTSWDPSLHSGDRCSGGLQFHEQEPQSVLVI